MIQRQVIRLTLSDDCRIHGWDDGAVVVDVHHLDPNGGGAAEGRSSFVWSLQNQPVM